MKVVFIKQYSAGNRSYKPGDILELNAEQAALFRRLGYVRLEVEPEEKRTYKRRDMKAER